MWKSIIVAVLVCGCQEDDRTLNDLPVIPNGGGTLPTTGPATTGPGPTTIAVISGQVCVLNDPRFLASCALTGASGLTVVLGNSRAVTGPTGAFSLPTPTGSNLVFTVSGPGIVTSSQPFSPVNTIPVLTQDMFGQVLTANGITVAPGTGTILASVVDRSGNPVSGATATSAPAPSSGPFFDGTSPTAFTLDATGNRGIVMFPGVNVGPAALTFSDLSTGGESTVGGVQVIDGGITLVDAVLP